MKPNAMLKKTLYIYTKLRGFIESESFSTPFDSGVESCSAYQPYI